MFHISSLKKNIDSLIAAMAGFAIIFLFTRHSGIGLCPDGVVYTTSAKNIAASCRYIDFRNYPVVEFPALYPLFLSAVIFITGLQPLVFGAILNALLFAIIIYVSGYITEKFTNNSKWHKAAILSCIVCSPALLEVYSMMWSETIYILWLLIFIILMHKYLQTHSRKVLIAAAIIAGLAAVTRYAGVTIIATGFVLMASDLKVNWRKKLTDIFIYCTIAPVLLIINLLRNYFIAGNITGMRERSLVQFHENLHDVGNVFYDWLPFFNHHYSGSEWITALIICCLFFICARLFINNKGFKKYEHIAPLFSLVYLSFMIITASISRFETLNSRFISPAFIPLLWSFSNELTVAHKNLQVKKWLLALGVVIFLCFQYGQLTTDFETWDGVKDAGIPGYTENQWQYSPTVLFIKKDCLPFLNGYTIYSNAYDAVYFFTKKPGKFLPNYENKPAVNSFLNDTKCYVIWFDDGDNPDLVGKDFIVNTKNMRTVKQFADGAIYEQDN